MDLHEYVGKMVLMNLTEAYCLDNNIMLGGGDPKARRRYARLNAVDEHGLWIENPKWTVRQTDTEEQVSHRIIFLVPWFALVSVALFPDRVFPNDRSVTDPDTQTIGFRPGG